MNEPDYVPINEEINPLLVWVAYMPGEGGKKNYLSDGKGHIRIFKTEDAAQKHLEDHFPPEVLLNVVVHSVQGTIAVPVDDVATASMVYEVTQTPVPIHTFAAPTAPTATEQLESLLKRRKNKRK